MAITKTIRALPTPPTRTDPENFDQRADEFLSELPGWGNDLNDWADQCNQTQQEINQARDETINARDVTLQYKNQAQQYTQEALQIKQDIESIATNLGYKGKWNSSETYNKGEVVLWQDVFYISLIDNNTGNQPDTSGSAWKPTVTSESVYAALYQYLTTTPVPFGIPLLDEDGYITSWLRAEFSQASNFTFTANTVFQAQHNAFLLITIGSSNVTYSFGNSNPPDQSLTLKANNTITLFVPKDMYVQFSVDTTAKILAKEVENVFV